MIALFRNRKFQVALMLYCAVNALIDAWLGQTLWAFAMIACSCWAMFRIWGGLREQSEP